MHMQDTASGTGRSLSTCVRVESPGRKNSVKLSHFHQKNDTDIARVETACMAMIVSHMVIQSQRCHWLGFC